LSNSSIIKPDDKDGYKVKKYSFTNLMNEDIPSNDTFIETRQSDNDNSIMSEAEDTNTHKNNSQLNDFEHILKKQDELTSEIIKLQMQLEHQKEDYEKRLEDEIPKAYDDGFKAAMEEAEKTINEDAKNISQKYLNSIKKLDEFLVTSTEHIGKVEPELSKISVEVANEIIQRELSDSSQEIAHAIAHSLIQEISSQAKIELKINPDDYDYITEQFKDKKHIITTSDSAIAKGGVIILSDIENIDASIKTRFENVKKLIK
jgi:flagellar assembly protein FliH